jgi:hypothetical protein
MFRFQNFLYLFLGAKSRHRTGSNHGRLHYRATQRDFLKAWASFVQEARTYGSKEETKLLLQEDLWFRVIPLKEEDLEIKSGSDGGPDRSPRW